MSRPLTITLFAFAIMTLASVGTAQVSPKYVPVPPHTPPPAQTVVRVERGDHLWKIADRSLRVRLGRPAGETEVAGLWRRVIDANRETIRSGDPDLIYPGEEIVVPDG